MEKGYARIKTRLNEVYVLEPNNLGLDFLNHWYRKFVVHFKVHPYVWIIPLTLLCSGIVWLIFGKFIVRLASFLQYGF